MSDRKDCRIKENRTFRRAFAKGGSMVCADVVIYRVKNGGKKARFGISCGKKIGSAVRRNRAKRVLRAAFYEIRDGIMPGFDLILVARSVTPDRKSTDVARSMKRLLMSNGLIAPDGQQASQSGE